MKVSIRSWKKSDAASLASAVSDKKILNNLRDELPYPYTETVNGLRFMPTRFW